MMGLQSKPSQIFVDGKPLGIAENVHFSTEDPVSDFKPGSYHNTVTLEVKNADMGPELKKIFDELNPLLAKSTHQGYGKPLETSLSMAHMSG